MNLKPEELRAAVESLNENEFAAFSDWFKHYESRRQAARNTKRYESLAREALASIEDEGFVDL